MTDRDGIGGTNGVQDYPHTGKYFDIDGRIRHCTGHHNTKGYQLFAVDPHGLRTADEVIYRANLDDEQEMALDTNFAPSKDGIPVPKKTKVHLMDCPKCKRVIDIGPTTTDICTEQPCGIVFNIQTPVPFVLTRTAIEDAMNEIVDAAPKVGARLHVLLANLKRDEHALLDTWKCGGLPTSPAVEAYLAACRALVQHLTGDKPNPETDVSGQVDSRTMRERLIAILCNESADLYAGTISENEVVEKIFDTLMNPTPSMQDAMERVDMRSVSTGRPHVEFIWQAGIDAAKDGK